MKYGAVRDLRFMAFAWLEFCLAFQVYISRSKKPLINVGIHSTYRHIQFRMVSRDLVGRLSLFDQRGNDLILFVKLVFGHISRTGGSHCRHTELCLIDCSVLFQNPCRSDYR